MKNLKTIALSLFALLALSTFGQTKTVDVAGSTINWVGKKVTGEHSGTINVKSGTLIFKKTILAGGTISVDMTTINTTDIKDAKGKANLDGHLKADDFFGTANYPTAVIVFKKIATKPNGVYTITADLTIKGTTDKIVFDMTTTANTATTSLKVDRTKYGIKYSSGNFFKDLGDKVISDEFELNVALKF